MKNILLAALLFPFVLSAQIGNFTTGKVTKWKTTFKVVDTSGNTSLLDISPEGEYTIEGDTLALIKLMHKQIERLDSINSLQTKSIEASAEWSNGVSDYFKIGNDKFTEYMKSLNALGYKGSIKFIRYTKPNPDRVL